MRRLREFDIVSISLPEGVPMRSDSIRCHVLATVGVTAALEPLQSADAAWLPHDVHGALMAFRHGGSLVALKGTLSSEGTVGGDLRFTVRDGVHERRRASRIDLRAPISLTVAGETHDGLTVNVSADGLLVEAPCAAGAGAEARFALSLPGADDPVEGAAMVVRTGECLVGLELPASALPIRSLLARVVLEHNRAVLRRPDFPVSALDF